MYRNSFSILATMLDVARDGAGMKIIRSKANLSQGQLRIFLNFLEEHKMVRRILLGEAEENARILVHTTPKGLEFLKRYNDLPEQFATDDHEEW